MVFVRSVRVLEGGKLKVWVLSWWEKVRAMLSSGGGLGSEVSAMLKQAKMENQRCSRSIIYVCRLRNAGACPWELSREIYINPHVIDIWKAAISRWTRSS